MSPYTFVATVRGWDQDVAAMSPDVLKAIWELVELVEEQERLLRTLLDVNRKLLDKKK